MKFTILCDELPRKCEECPFWQSTLAKKEGVGNAFDIVESCSIGGESYDKCPLTEVKTIWDGSETND